MQFKIPLLLLGLIPVLTSGTPMPVPIGAASTDSESVTKRAMPTCPVNYIPACCTPPVAPGASSGCVPMPPAGCPATQSNSRACCEEDPVTKGKLRYKPNGTVSCTTGV